MVLVTVKWDLHSWVVVCKHCVHGPWPPSPERQHAASSLMSLLTPSQQALTAFINNNNNKKTKIAEQVNPGQLYHVAPLSTPLLCSMKPMDYYHVIASGHVCSRHTWLSHAGGSERPLSLGWGML